LNLPHDIGGALVCTVNDFSSRLVALWVDAHNASEVERKRPLPLN
jgi:hypothetical protein